MPEITDRWREQGLGAGAGAGDGDSAGAATSFGAGKIWQWHSKEMGAALCRLRPNEIGRPN